MNNKTVEEIVREYIKANGFDGLWNDAGDCACKGDQLFCCGEVGMECKAGCLQTVPVNSEYEYMIGVVNHGGTESPETKTTLREEQVLRAMWDAKIKMLEVGEYLKAYEHGEWPRHSGEIIGAAKLLDSWIEGFKKEIMGEGS